MFRKIITAENFFRNFSPMMFGENKRISTKGILLIKNFEGKSLTPYNDPPGSSLYSIGYGHQIKPGEEYLMQGIDDQKAEDLLIQDLVTSVNAVNDTIQRTITQDQFDALVSYAYNIGTGSFKSGTLEQLVNSNASQSTIENFWTNHYITASGIYNPALKDRRQQEFDYFTSSSDQNVFTASLMPTTRTGKIIFFSAASLILLGALENKKAV
jgi:lysozyme